MKDESRIDKLEERIDELETELEFWRESYLDLEELVVGEYGTTGAHREYPDGLTEAISRIAAGAAPPEEADPDETLPIQQIRRTYQADPDALSANEQRAAVLWGEYFDECNTTPNKYVLDSKTVRTILRVADDGDVHHEDVRRSMNLLADLSGGYVELEKRKNTLKLVMDRDRWSAFVQDLERSISEGVAD